MLQAKMDATDGSVELTKDELQAVYELVVQMKKAKPEQGPASLGPD